MFRGWLSAGMGLLVLLVAPVTVPAFEWPEGKRAAISLAYDDALSSQLDHAIPALDAQGFRGTFYLTLASPTVRDRMDEWRGAAARGHELGNHTLFHPCRGSLEGRDWVSRWNDLDRMTVVEMRAHIELASTVLHAIDGETDRTYTAVCADQLAGGDPYLPAVADLFLGMKTVFAHDGIVADMDTLDLSRVPVNGPSDWTAEQMIEIAQRAAAQGTMANYTFHGVGGDHLAVSVEAHREFLQHLADNPDDYWVDSFVNIMRWVRAQREPKNR